MKKLIILSMLIVGIIASSSAMRHSSDASPHHSPDLAIGSGSECQYGCNETPLNSCVAVYDVVLGVPIFRYALKTTRNPHWECRFAWGPDNCVPGPDAACISKEWYSTVDCSGSPYDTDYTTTSTCPAPTGPGGPG